MRLLLLRTIFVITLFFSQSAIADSSAVLTLGGGPHAKAVDLGLQIPVQPPWDFLRSPKISTDVEFAIGWWEGRGGSQNNRLVEVALLPIVRYFPGNAADGRFFWEGGIGAHLLSQVRIREDRSLSTAFQFGDFLGLGWRFGQTAKYEMGLRAHHVSNAGIKNPNPGVNFIQLRLAVPFS